MPQKSNRPAVLRGTWRPEETEKSKPAWKKRLALIFVFLLLAAGIWLFFYLLIQPIRHPNTFLLLAKSDNWETWSVAPIHFAEEDLQQFRAVEPSLARQSQQTFAEPIALVANDELSRIRERLTELDIRSNDVLVLFVSSHGLVIDQSPSLISQGFDPDVPGTGTFSVKSLLRIISQSPAKTKLLILDSGQQPIDSRLGIIAKQFPRLLQEAVDSLEQNNVWVLSSNDTGQRALVSEIDRRSVFAYFVQQGLIGHADSNQNKIITVKELFEYVRDRVSQYTSLYTDGPMQTPILLASPRSLDNSTLLSVPQTNADIAAGNLPSDTAETSSADLEQNPVEQDLNQQTAKANSATAANESKTAGDEVESSSAPNDSSQPDSSMMRTTQFMNDVSADGTDLGRSLIWNPRLSAPLLKDLKSSWDGTYSNHADLVEATWNEYFSMMEALDYPNRPIDFAPIAWRQVGKAIVKYDYQIRRGVDREKSADRLREITLALQSIKNNTPIPENARFDSVEAIEQAVQKPMVRSSSVSAFSHWNALESQGFAIADPELRKSISQFEAALNSPDVNLMRKWISDSVSIGQWYEPWLTERLLENRELDWQQVKDAIALTLVSGVASNPVVVETTYLKRRFREADQLRRKAIRFMLDKTSPEWQVLAKRLLAESRRRYESATHETRMLTQAIGLRNEMLFRLPYYLRLPYANNDRLENDFYTELNKLLDAISKLDSLLRKADKLSGLSAIIMVSENVHAIHDDFLSLLLPQLPNALQGQFVETKSSIDLQSALLQPVFAPAFRSYALSILKKESAKNPLASMGQTAMRQVEESAKSDGNELFGYQRQIQVELKLAKLAEIHGVENGAYSKLTGVAEASVPADVMTVTNDLQRIKIEEAEQAIADFYYGLPNRIEAAFESLSDAPTIESHQAILKSMRLLQVSGIAVDTTRLLAVKASIITSNRVNLATCFEVLNAQYDLLRSELSFETLESKSKFRKGLEFQRLAINELSGQPKIQRSTTGNIEILGAKSVSLTSRPQVQVDIKVRFSGSEPTPVWLFFDYDPVSINARANTRNTATDQHRVTFNTGELESELNLVDNKALLSAIADQQIAPSFIAKPGEEEELRFQISTLERAADSKLIIKAITGTEYVRHETVVRLPAKSDWTLFFDSPYSTTQQSDSVIALSPLPNQTIDYGIFLRNRSGRSRNIRIDILAPERAVTTNPPSGELKQNQLAEYLERVGRVRSVFQNPKFDVDSSDSNQRIQMQTTELSDTGGDGNTKKDDAPPAADEKIKLMVRNGFFVVVTDNESLESRVWLVRFRPQMPRRFLSAIAGYDKVTERIELQFTANDGHQIPNGGHQIKCSFANSDYRATESQLNGLITEKNRSVRLFAYVPRSIDRVEKVYIEIDDYPRAFVFRIPCWDDNARILESKNEMRFQFESPSKGKSYLAPVDSIPIGFQVDAPVGAFEDNNDFLEIGIDADRDRELNKESAVRIFSDRQADIWLVDVGKTNGLTIENKVSDFTFNLPGNGYRNAKVNLLGKIKVGSSMAWSNPVEIILDGAPPTIERVLQTPNRNVSPEEEFQVRIMAEDGGLSGVASVKIGFADPLEFKFNEKSPPIAAEKQLDESWLAILPLADSPLGVRTILIAATDQVGNVSKFKKIKINIVSKAEREAAMTKRLYSINGLVVYYGQPSVDVDVVVLANDEIIKKAKTLADGSFEIKELPAGKYKLKAKSVIRNKPRIDSRELILGEERSDALIRLDLK